MTDSTPSSNSVSSFSSNDGEARILLILHCSALLAGHPHELHVLVRVQAPARQLSLTTSKPQHLALVIDRSGSMAGQPLAEAVACARHLIGRLGPDDELALIAYNDHVAPDPIAASPGPAAPLLGSGLGAVWRLHQPPRGLAGRGRDSLASGG